MTASNVMLCPLLLRAGSDQLLQFASRGGVPVWDVDAQSAMGASTGTLNASPEYAAVKQRVMNAVNGHFSPEFLNRLGALVL